ncbi:hypothetical protein OOK58_09535 [Streptomyces sp. NBC_01728]|uniref:hypothetical protein n=1 Tax=unclassified Streptomyces TaxID=2593676 RepID=UPI0022540FF2|nr:MULTISPECIES: hypothetical protein [unclassified Streptomyces]MCX4452354.1 hypothetical protein [Streptomyces sp. NBC_01719]MCX4491714.1 hypothetical protein [Streptomyces sp. NBC_01728]
MRRRFWATLPARLRLLRAVVLVLSAALTVLLLLAGLAASGTWDAVAGRDAPRTTSAADLNLALNDMDAQAANILLSSGNAGKGRLQTPYDKAVGFYGDARKEIGHDLRTLAVAAQGDRNDERTVESLTDDFAGYQELIGRSLENDGRAGGKQAALADYRTATDLLQSKLLPDSRQLVSSNNRAFERQYDQARSSLVAQLATVIALGILLLAVLGVLQWYLVRRLHRILNPGVLAATVCALFAVIVGSQLLSATGEHLRGARRDAFDSVVALSRARAIAYDANADESRYLLDPGRRDQYARSFLAKSMELYGLRGATLSSYDSELATTWRAYQADHHDLRFTGEFRRELDNITFVGERAAAEKTVETYAVYQRDDRKIRALVAQGKEQEAVAFCISWEPGMSNAHFGAYMDALGKLITINRGHFAASVSDGRGTITGLLPWTCGALSAVALLTLLGLRPRLAEFR